MLRQIWWVIKPGAGSMVANAAPFAILKVDAGGLIAAFFNTKVYKF
jgi:hypothetical protein